MFWCIWRRWNEKGWNNQTKKQQFQFKTRVKCYLIGSSCTLNTVQQLQTVPLTNLAALLEFHGGLSQQIERWNEMLTWPFFRHRDGLRVRNTQREFIKAKTWCFSRVLDAMALLGFVYSRCTNKHATRAWWDKVKLLPILFIRLFVQIICNHLCCYSYKW